MKKFVVVIGFVILVVGLIICLIIFSEKGQPPKPRGAPAENTATPSNIAVLKIYEVEPKSAYLTVCFNDKPHGGGVKIDAFSGFRLKYSSFDGNCVDFLINDGQGIGQPGEYETYLSAEAENGSKLEQQKITLKVVADLSANPQALLRQNAAVNRNNDVDLNSLRESDPIYQFLYNPYKTKYFSIAEQVSREGEIILVIHFNMLRPAGSDTRGKSNIETYKNEALDKIRQWGFQPNDYQIKYEYDEVER